MMPASSATGNKTPPKEAATSASATGSLIIPQIAIAVFTETEELARTAEAAASDRRLQRTRLTVHGGGLPAAIELYGKGPTPNLIIVETTAENAALFAGLNALADVCLTSTKVIVIGHRNDITLYRELIEQGIHEYVVAPLDVMSLIATIGRLYKSAGAQKLGKVCAFFGARGGVGSSTVAHNTAWSLASSFDSDVLLIDMDLPFGTAGLDFNIEAAQGVMEAISDADRLDDVLLERIMTQRGERLSILTPPLALTNAYDLRETDFNGLIDIARSSARLTILDLPHMWTAWVKRLLTDADDVVITAAPDLANMRNVKGVIEFLRSTRPHDSPPKLVLNQIGIPKRPEIKAPAFATAVALEPCLRIPFDPALFGNAANDGRMIGETSARSPVARSFDELAHSLISGKAVSRPARKGINALAARLVGRR